MRPTFDTFVFTGRAVEASTVRLGYRLEGRSGARCSFEERLEFSEPIRPGLVSHPALEAALAGLHVMAGVSYWKAACPPEIRFETAPPAADEMPYWAEVYTRGLGEFFHNNGIDPTGAVRFPEGGAARAPVAAPALEQGVYVLNGGGKDSVVSLEVARASGEAVSALTIGESAWTRRAVGASGFPHTVVARRIDPALIALNREGALNGHVPISAILAHASLLIALATGRAAVISSNERSASQGNLIFHGMEVNHQWSKGLRFESLFQGWASRAVAGGPQYFSLLRPLGELRIARAFARHPRYFDSITSCNANFRASNPASERWCGRCPKCIFVYAILRPFLDEPAAGRLFGRSFFADPASIDMIARLTGDTGHKPFECVGTPEETVAALAIAARAGVDRGTPVMRWFEQRGGHEQDDRCIEEAMSVADEHRVPARWQELLHGYLRDH